MLENNGTYEHMDYFAGGSKGMNGVLKTTAALFRRQAAWLAGDAWIDLERLHTLRPYLVVDGPSVFDQLVSAVKLALDPMGCSITWHNRLLPPYHKDSHPDRVILEAAGHQVGSNRTTGAMTTCGIPCVWMAQRYTASTTRTDCRTTNEPNGRSQRC